MHEQHRKRLCPGHFIAGYSIVREIGHGGFGIVYEAINPVTEDRAAIKQFYPQVIASWIEGTIVVNRTDDKEVVERVLKRFEDEARLQYRFNHPNILKVKNFVRADNTGYQISEYIDGTPLSEFLKQYGTVFPDAEMFRRVMQPIADAVGYVHRMKVLHRDISPDNILIERSGRAVLVDFGAAKLDLLRSPKISSIVPYKEAYAPVEQQVPAAERPEGFYTDIYALAGTMYCALSGSPPQRAIERRLASRDPYVPLAQIAKVKCPEAVYAAIDRALALPAEDRPQAMEDFIQMLGWRETAAPPIARDAKPAPLALADAKLALPAEQSVTVSPLERSGNWRAHGVVALLIAGVAGALVVSTRPDPPTTPSPSIPKDPVSPTTPSEATAATPIKSPNEVFELSLYQTALSCLQSASASTCDIDYCLKPYRDYAGQIGRYPALWTEYLRLTKRCRLPTPTPTLSATAPPTPSPNASRAPEEPRTPPTKRP
jgi:serine/threonine protein kinase